MALPGSSGEVAGGFSGGFWAENIDFSLVFEGFGGGERVGAVGAAAGLGPPKTSF